MPHFLSAPDGDLLAFTGLWESWRRPETGEDITTCTIIVREAKPGRRSITTACRACSCDRILSLGWTALEAWNC